MKNKKYIVLVRRTIASTSTAILPPSDFLLGALGLNLVTHYAPRTTYTGVARRAIEKIEIRPVVNSKEATIFGNTQDVAAAIKLFKAARRDGSMMLPFRGITYRLIIVDITDPKNQRLVTVAEPRQIKVCDADVALVSKGNIFHGEANKAYVSVATYQVYNVDGAPRNTLSKHGSPKRLMDQLNKLGVKAKFRITDERMISIVS